MSRNTNPSYASTTINHKHSLLCPKQSSQHRCSIPQQTRACLDRSWYRRQAARVKTNAVSPKRASPRTKQQLPHNEIKTDKASPGRCHCYPSTTPRRCCSAHRNDTANNVSRSHDSVPTPTINRKQFVLRPKQSSQRRCSSLEQLGRCICCFPSTRLRRCRAAHRNDTANSLSRNTYPSFKIPEIQPSQKSTPQFKQHMKSNKEQNSFKCAE